MSHPNAAAGLVGGSGGGALLVYLLALVGVHVPLVFAPALGGFAAAFVLFVGRNGLRGIVRVAWRGTA